MKADSVGECSSHRGAPTWLEGHLATLSAVKASQITICNHLNLINSDSKHRLSKNINVTALRREEKQDRPHCLVRLLIAQTPQYH